MVSEISEVYFNNCEYVHYIFDRTHRTGKACEREGVGGGGGGGGLAKGKGLGGGGG